MIGEERARRRRRGHQDQVNYRPVVFAGGSATASDRGEAHRALATNPPASPAGLVRFARHRRGAACGAVGVRTFSARMRRRQRAASPRWRR
ncbi:MAG: hypothetical protein MZW92_34720 [Comamonadaceae bacterium]|nr:hypothetical protein [Comamonadaceae bacterium]